MKKLAVCLVVLVAACMISGVCLADLNDRLVAYYPFNGNANDESGNEHHGTPLPVGEGPTLTEDQCGMTNSAYKFDGLNDYIQVNDAVDLRLDNTDFSVSAWVFQTARNADWADMIVGKRLNENMNGWSFHIAANKFQELDPKDIGKLSYAAGNEHFVRSDSTVPLINWTHCLIVYRVEERKVQFYINELLDGTRLNIPPPDPDPTVNMFIGKDTSVEFEYNFSGTIDEARIYNRALSEAEIRELYYMENCAKHGCQGDFDRDGDVDSFDLSVFASNYGRTDCCNDKLWNIRINVQDYFHSNESYVRPWRVFVDDGFGVFIGEHGYEIEWHDGPFTNNYGSVSGLSWSVDKNGKLIVKGPKDIQWHAWTYVYVGSATALTIQTTPNSGWSCHRIFLNYDFDNPYGPLHEIPGTLDLTPGWNRIDVTGYNQNDYQEFDLNIDLANHVDMMSSIQCTSPGN